MNDIKPNESKKMLNKAYYIRFDNGNGLESQMDIYEGSNFETNEHKFLKAGKLTNKQLKYIKIK